MSETTFMKKKTSVEVLSASLALTLSPSLASAGSDIARDANGRDSNPSDEGDWVGSPRRSRA